MCKILITFNGSRGAIKADEVLRKADVICQIIATPSHISSECGMSILVSKNQNNTIVELFSKENIEFNIHNY